MRNVPIPFDESEVENRFWKPDPWDKFLPSPGFITDLVLTLRGIKTPTKYQVWSALWILSSVIKRDAELKWGPLTFFFNLFVFLVGPPAIGKTSVLSWANANLFTPDFPSLFESQEFGYKKVPRLIHSRGTSEGLFKFLQPEKKQIIEPGKIPRYVNTDSNASIISGELTTFLGRQQYNVGLIEKLTSLYDCENVVDEILRGNSGSGLKEIKNPYVTLIGGITPDGMEQSIPEAAMGDGFLSRVIVVYQRMITRSNPFPVDVFDSSIGEKLRERLAWIAENARGIYTLADDVAETHSEWYDKWIESMNSDPTLMKKTYSRYDVHLLKTAALIRANRYEPGTEITMQDYMDAKNVLYNTLCDTPMATAGIGADPVMKTMSKLEEYLGERKGVERKKFLNYFSGRGVRAANLDAAIRELHQAGKLTIWSSKEKEKEKSYPSSDGREFYEWINGG